MSNRDTQKCDGKSDAGRQQCCGPPHDRPLQDKWGLPLNLYLERMFKHRPLSRVTGTRVGLPPHPPLTHTCIGTIYMVERV